jgi:hypothetical protein
MAYKNEQGSIVFFFKSETFFLFNTEILFFFQASCEFKSQKLLSGPNIFFKNRWIPTQNEGKNIKTPRHLFGMCTKEHSSGSLVKSNKS